MWIHVLELVLGNLNCGASDCLVYLPFGNVRSARNTQLRGSQILKQQQQRRKEIKAI